MNTFCESYAQIKLINKNEQIETYSAINSITNTKTILKFFNVKYDKENLQSNIEMLKEMKNTNFINLKNSGEYKGDDKICCYIEVEYFESKTLREKMKLKNYSLVESMKIVKDIAKGLKEFHSKGLIFKNLSCDNIYIDNNDKVKLDISTYLYKDKSEGKEEDLSEQDDIYCLGVILFQLITNKVDFIIEKAKYNIEDKHLLLIINKCTNKQYSKYEDLNYLIEDLNNYIGKCTNISFSTACSNYKKDENSSENPYKFQPLKFINNLCICGLVFLMITTVLNGNSLFKIKKSEVSSNKMNVTTTVKSEKQVAKNTKNDEEKDKDKQQQKSSKNKSKNAIVNTSLE